MARAVTLPELGENLTSVEITAVLVADGETVQADQPLVEVETEKASLEIPSPFSGVVREIHVRAGDRVQVGERLLSVEPGAEDAAGAPRAAADPEPEAVAESAPVSPVAEPAPPAPAPAVRETVDVHAPPPRAAEEPAPARRPETGDPVPAAPSVRRLARELGVEVARVPGSGPGGRISIADVKAYAKRLLTRVTESGEPTPPAGAPLPDFARFGDVQRQPLGALRRTAARNLGRAWTVVPHVTQFDRSDVTELEVWRRDNAPRVERQGAKLTVTAIVMRVVADALHEFPEFNASLDVEREEVVLRKYVHLGVAVDTERGLLVPVLRDVDRKGIARIAVELGELAGKARTRKIAPDDLQGSCFTVSNLGGLGTTYFSPIVNWPEVAILGVGRAETSAVYREGGFVPRSILPLSLSYDHRWIDGAGAARFLRWIARALEQPASLALV